MKKSRTVVIAALCAFAIPVQSMDCTRSIGRSTVCFAKYSFPVDYYWWTYGIGTLSAFGPMAQYDCGYPEIHVTIMVDYTYQNNLFLEGHGFTCAYW